MANTARLVIDPVSRKITTKYEKIRLVQHDNNSTRVTFEMPRYVRGHDMSRCSTVEVHYDNISIDRKQKRSDVYVVTDIIVAPEDDETINFSWLVSRGATQIVGNLDFSLHFGCNEDPDLEYAWHTTPYSGIVVLEGKHNTPSVVEKHPDLVASILDYVDKKISEFDAVDIAQETGESTEAVMSQKAVTDALGGKVDKITKGGNLAYVTNANGYLTVSASNYSGQIATYGNANSGKEDKGGFLATSTPQNPYQAANMRYVDAADAILQEDMNFLKRHAFGTLYDLETVESTDNPVTVPANALSEATIDKIGTGIKTEVINEAVPNTNEAAQNGITVTYDEATDLYTLSSDFESIAIPTLTIKTPISVTEGEKFYISFEFVSGSVESSMYDNFMLGSWQYNVTVHFGETHVLGECVADSDEPISELTFNLSAAPCKFNDFTFRLHIGKQKQTYGVPVASVKKGTETIYTVPEAIRTLTYSVTGDSQSYPVYGLAMSDTVYNYLDLEEKKYVVKCYTDFFGEIAETNATIDVSAYLTDEDGEVTVAAGDEILFVDAEGNSAGNTVPNTITYAVKKGG